MFRFVCLALLALAACQPIPPITPPPDASDASILPTEAAPPALDAPAPPPGSADCVAACAALVAAGCVQLPTCAATLTQVDAHRLNLDPSIDAGDNHLTCAALKTVKRVADVQRHGWSCGPSSMGHRP